MLHPAFIPTCLVMGLGVRMAFAIAFPVTPTSDAAWYMARARELATGFGYQEGGIPTAFWPVGWPAILAAGTLLLKSIPVTVITLNLIGAGVIMGLILWFAQKVLASDVVGRLGMFAYAIYPNHIAYTGMAMTETVYTAIAMGGFAVLICWRKMLWGPVVSGLLFGVATLIKPQSYLFPIGAIIALIIIYRDYSWRSALRGGVILYCLLFAVVLPWSMRNLEVFGEFVLVSTNGGTALLLGANDQITGEHFEYEYTPVYAQFNIPLDQRVARQVELDGKQMDRAVEWIKENTWAYVAWMPRKVFLLWYKDTDGFWALDESYPQAHVTVQVGKIVNQIYYMLVLLLSLPCALFSIRALIRRSESDMPLGFLFCMPIFLSLLAAIFTGQFRYHFPAMPYMMLAAAWTLVRFSELMRTSRSLDYVRHASPKD